MTLALPFGNPSTYPGHSGVDFPQPPRALVRASGRGVVTRRGWINGNAGYGVIVAYDDIRVPVLYCHFPDTERVPEVGARVDAYGVIGTVGTTGRSTGPHLHMEIMEGNGAHTFGGVWNYFNRSVIGAPASSSRRIMSEDEMIALRITDNNGTEHLCTLGIGVFRHLIQDDDPERMMKIVTMDDEWTRIKIHELPRVLKTYACPPEGIYDIDSNGQFRVRDTDTGLVMPGGAWHRWGR